MTETNYKILSWQFHFLESTFSPFFSDFDVALSSLSDTTFKVTIVLLLVILGVLLIVFLIKYVTRSQPGKPAPSKEIARWSSMYRFSKAEIENAMGSEKERKSLGRGSAGCVYKGILPSGQAVAIKHINKSNRSDSFVREVESFSRVRHPNLVSLLGYCIERGEQYLVYEYCPAGNLAEHLLSNLSFSFKLLVLAINLGS